MGQTVLVIEDDRNIADLLRIYLEKDGFSVHIAADGGSGVAECKILQPDLILLDIIHPFHRRLSF